ncbi:hypothetical protein [Saccharopolyspora halophila]|uniref:hypothetical protein n=1 Tax=Saccharopolyspora halophila TaxID=405551 RepID=UPI0031D71C0E
MPEPVDRAGSARDVRGAALDPTSSSREEELVAGRYRYRCGECPYRAPWSTESQSAQRRRNHEFRHHPGEPGGRFEVRERGRVGAG